MKPDTTTHLREKKLGFNEKLCEKHINKTIEKEKRKEKVGTQHLIGTHTCILIKNKIRFTLLYWNPHLISKFTIKQLLWRSDERVLLSPLSMIVDSSGLSF